MRLSETGSLCPVGRHGAGDPGRRAADQQREEGGSGESAPCQNPSFEDRLKALDKQR